MPTLDGILYNGTAYDLGLFAYNNGTSFFASNAKIYSNMIYDHELELSEGDSAFLEGYYRFY